MARKLPELTDETAAFWQGGESGELNIFWCSACSRYFHPPAPVCPDCLGFEVAPVPVSGRGKVVTFTINMQAWTEELAEPYVVAIVELEEQAGLRFLTNIVGGSPEDVFIDMKVRVAFEQVEDVWIPVFERSE